MPVIIYTDGACKGNPGPGGWGAVLQWGSATKELFGGVAGTTNNRMEMTAAIMALQALTRKSHVILHTDSTYVKQGVTEWLPRWRQQAGGVGLARKGGKPVKNADLWESLAVTAARHQVEWRWVKGHADCAGNVRADQLAGRGAAQAMENA